MSKLKFKLNRKGVRKLLKSEEVQTVIAEQAERVKRRCGKGFSSDMFIGKRRAIASVWPKSPAAKRRNKRHNTLLKAVR